MIDLPELDDEADSGDQSSRSGSPTASFLSLTRARLGRGILFCWLLIERTTHKTTPETMTRLRALTVVPYPHSRWSKGSWWEPRIHHLKTTLMGLPLLMQVYTDTISELQGDESF